VHQHGSLSADEVGCAARVLWQGVNESGSGMNDKSIVDGVGTRPILILSEIRPHSCAELVPVHAAVEERGFRRHPVQRSKPTRFRVRFWQTMHSSVLGGAYVMARRTISEKRSFRHRNTKEEGGSKSG
jgi:hypothetical protein